MLDVVGRTCNILHFMSDDLQLPESYNISRRGRGRPMTTFTPAARAAFLKELEVLGTAQSAAAAAGIPVTVAHYHRQNDPEFAEQWQAALDRLDRSLMGQVRRMALDGVVVREIKDAAGNVLAQERKYSERVLLAYLRRMESGSWREQVSVEQTGTVKHEHTGRIEAEKLSPEQVRAARAFLATLPA